MIHFHRAAIHISLAVFLLFSTSLYSQIQYDTIQWWNLAQYSTVTIENLAADTDNWYPMSKNGTLQRYANNVVTTGETLKANGVIITELNGLLVGKGIGVGNVLLRHNMGSSQNGMQMQSNAPITIPNLKKGQKVLVTIKSSSSTAQGIASVTNLHGICGEGSYTSTSFKTYNFEVIDDGDISWTNSGGVVVQSAGVLDEQSDANEKTATPQIIVNGKEISFSCETTDAIVWYSLVNHGDILDYARIYTEPFNLTQTCRIRAMARKEGMRTSDIAETTVEVPLVFPFAGRPQVIDPEPLNRGAIATFTGSSKRYLINWRWLINDPEDICFNVYRDGTKLNTTPLYDKTNLLDTNGSENAVYTIEAISEGEVIETSTATILAKGYLEIPLNRPAGGILEGEEYYYIPDRKSVV